MRRRLGCDDWSICINGVQQRECYDTDSCGTSVNKPITEENVLKKTLLKEEDYMNIIKNKKKELTKKKA